MIAQCNNYRRTARHKLGELLGYAILVLPIATFMFWLIWSNAAAMLWLLKIAGVFWVGMAIFCVFWALLHVGIGGIIDLVKAHLKRIRTPR